MCAASLDRPAGLAPRDGAMTQRAGAVRAARDSAPSSRLPSVARLDVNGRASCARYPTGYSFFTRYLKRGESRERARGLSRRVLWGLSSGEGVIVFRSSLVIGCSECRAGR